MITEEYIELYLEEEYKNQKINLVTYELLGTHIICDIQFCSNDWCPELHKIGLLDYITFVVQYKKE